MDDHATLPIPPPVSEAFAFRRGRETDISECALLPEARREKWAHFDLERFPFPALVAQILGADLCQGKTLDRLHESNDVQRWLSSHSKCRAYDARRSVVDRRLKESGGFRNNPPLKECYENFVREVVLPLVPDALEGGLAFQREPNIRVHLPETGHPLVQRHRDADYHHQPNALNFWVPCTPCFGANTLWIESDEGAEDFHPLECAAPGQVVRFWGQRCDHFSFPNDTDSTRLSFDFRVAPLKHFQERYPHSHSASGDARFALGGFYAVMRGDGVVDEDGVIAPAKGRD